MPPKTTTPADRIARLRTELNHHNHLYYVEARPVITDLEFDRLLKELEALEAAHPELASPDSPTQRVGGAPVPGLKTIAHRVPMLSIDNAYNVAELRKFDATIRKEAGLAKVRYVVEPKIDGASISLVYRDGLFDYGVSRGDGKSGDDVSHNLKTVGGLPLRLRTDTPPAYFEARGEVYMTKADFARLNASLKEQGEKEYANPRNLTAGSLRLLDPRECARRKLRLFAYSTGHVEGITLASQTDVLETLRRFGFPVASEVQTLDDIEAVIACCEKWAERQFDLPYDIDGLVIKMDDVAARAKLGSTSKHIKWAIAYKFEAEQAFTKLLNVEFSVGKYGEQTPVAIMAPVVLDATTVQRASLHNAVQVQEKDIRLGDTVIVVKRGKIIPYVERPLKELRTGEEKPVVFPQKCVKCGSPTRLNDTGNVWCCTATHTCPAQLSKRLESYAKRERMDITGLGEETCDALVAAGLVKTVADLYKLTEEQLLTVPRMGKKSAQNLLKGIEDSKGRGLGRLLGGLSIPNVGESMGPILAQKFGSLDAILAAPPEQLAATEGFGPVRAASIKAYFGSPEGQALVAGLRAAGVKLTEDVKVQTGPAVLAGKTVVVTGTLVKYTRATIEARIAELGAKVGSGVSKNTDLLVVGSDAGSKLAKAQALGVKTMGEDEFEQMVEQMLKAAPGGKPANGSSAGPLAGKTVCVTGTLANHDRRGVEALIVAKGGKAASGVSKNVDLVLAGDDAGSKLAKALELGIRVIDEAEFERLIGGK